MNAPLWFSNLVFWSAQVALLILATAFLIRLLRIRQPRVLLVHWRMLLLISLLLPFLQPWHRPPILGAISTAPDIFLAPAIPAPSPVHSLWHFPDFLFVAQILGAVIVAGIAVRLAILLLGLFRLRQFRRASSPIPTHAESAALLEQMRAHVQTRAEFRLSTQVDSPVTFGLATPVILLPERFLHLDARFQSAIACHELLHVRRRDWTHHLAEESFRVAFWFHPAILWLIARIRLAREQVVDLEVVRLTQARKPYLEALLEFTTSRSRIAAIPAPPFLAERQLVERVALMLKEAGMSRRRLIASLSVIGCGLAGAAILVVSVFPLKASPRAAAEAQETQIAPRGAAPILRIVGVKYHGFDDATLNDTTVQEQREYLERFLKDPPRVETPYDQKKVDEMKRLIKSFWKEKGVEVEVRSILTPIPNTRYARVIFDVQRYLSAPRAVAQTEKAQAVSEPVVNAESIWTGKVEQGTMYINVRGLGTLTLLNGKPIATVELPEQRAADVRVGQSAQVDTHKGVVRGHVMRVSLQVLSGTRNVYIALDSALPAGLDANAQVEGTITIAKLENVLYVGRPIHGDSDATGSLFKIIDNGKEAVHVNVHFGRVSVSTIQVLSGLNIGDTVILSEMSPYDKFDRIQIKR